ncbi:MAG TPA: sigma-70 family RNA polymerase sigma factor [Marmoricola sp.]|nr:sigma-70 family RNA polymerase sigma factor [Marmoricola sp.]
MDEAIVERARDGDQDAFAALVEPYRRELQVHCYRILGSVHDAEDALQETLLAAWQGFGGFEGRSSVRTWLYRVATNRCLDLLRSRARRPPEGGMTVRGIEPPEPSRRNEVFWLQPYPDVLLDELTDPAPGPEATVEAREATSLAFIAALQLLPPRQRAVLILRDVLGYRAREVAAMLDSTEESVTSALKRARATVAAELGHRSVHASAPAANSPEETRLVERFVDAFTRSDVDGLVALLTDDAWISMPPMPFEYHGREAARRFFEVTHVAGARSLRFVHTRANGQPALATYLKDEAAAVWRSPGILVLTLCGDRLSDLTHFPPEVLSSFGLPRTLPD